MTDSDPQPDDPLFEGVSLTDVELTAPLTTPQPYDENDIDQVRARLAACEIVISEHDERVKRIIADRDQRRGIITKLQLELQALRTENEGLRKRISQLEGRPTV